MIRFTSVHVIFILIINFAFFCGLEVCDWLVASLKHEVCDMFSDIISLVYPVKRVSSFA
jgi:hypothetical protein